MVLLWQRLRMAQHPLHRVKGSTPGVLAGAGEGKEQVGEKGEVPELRASGAELHLLGSQTLREDLLQSHTMAGVERDL